MKKLLSIMLLAAVVSACGIQLLTPTQKDADFASQKFPGTTVADLEQGKALFEQNCNKCHGLNKAAHKSEEELRKVVPSMAKKAKLDEHSGDLVLRYLVTMNTEK